jgi:lactoylglutathione lyase
MSEGEINRRLDYVILYVEDLARSIAFYRDLVGLPFKLSEHGYAEFKGEGVKFGLFERERLSDLIGEISAPAGPAHEVAFLVEDADAEFERLSAEGVRILRGPQDRPWGHRTLHFVDPDGYVVEFAQEIERQTPREDDDG